MKHLMALAAACLLLWSFAAAETDALARYDELERQAAAAVLEMEIVQLERQIAQLRGDQAAISAADEKESSILAWQEEIRLAMADLAIPLVMALEERADTLDQEIQALQAQLEDINAAIRESSAARKDALALRSEMLRNYGLTASAAGYGGNVTVRLLQDDNGSIAYMQVDAPRETPAIAKPCTEEAFISQFIGKQGPFLSGWNVDVVSGATLTSKAVFEAVNSLYPDGRMTASARGLLSDVQVTVYMDAACRILDIQVDASGETQAIARPCTEEAFLSQFIGRSGPFDDVDTVAGATYTSRAVINALNSLYPGEGANAE